MKDTGGKLNRKHEQAVVALLNEPTLQAAAACVGVGEVTLWRWMQREDFHKEYRQARRKAVSVAIAGIQRASSEAVRTLREVMTDNDAPCTSRVTAAKAVLELALKAVELEDLAERVETLERIATGSRGA
jgi:hypothetical protein